MTKMMAARKREIDDIDREILALLQRSPLETNAAIARALSLNEVTVAARIRAMETNGVMRVMAQKDFRAEGYEVLAVAELSVAGRSVLSVARDLAKLPSVAVVQKLMGDPALSVLLMAADMRSLQRVLDEGIGRIKGIRSMDTTICSEIIKYQTEFANL